MSYGRAILLLNNALDYATIRASTERPTAPVRRVRTSSRSEYYRSAAGTESRITVILPAPVPLDYFALVDSNLTKNGTIRVQAWSDALDGAAETLDIERAPTLYDDPTIPSKPYGGVFGGPYGIPAPEAAVNARPITLGALPTEMTSRFWAFTLTDPTTRWQQLGYLYLGKATRYAYDISWEWSLERVELSVSEKSIGGQTKTDIRECPLQLRGQFEYLTNAERQQALIMMQLYGQHRPFVISLRPGNDLDAITTTLFGRFNELRIAAKNVNRNLLSVGVLEDL